MWSCFSTEGPENTCVGCFPCTPPDLPSTLSTLLCALGDNLYRLHPRAPSFGFQLALYNGRHSQKIRGWKRSEVRACPAGRLRAAVVPLLQTLAPLWQHYLGHRCSNSPDCYLPFLTSSGWGTWSPLGWYTTACESPPTPTTQRSMVPVYNPQGLHLNVPLLSSPWLIHPLNERDEWHPGTGHIPQVLRMHTRVGLLHSRCEYRLCNMSLRIMFVKTEGAMVGEGNFMLSQKRIYFGKSSYMSGGKYTSACRLTRERKSLYLSSSQRTKDSQINSSPKNSLNEGRIPWV